MANIAITIRLPFLLNLRNGILRTSPSGDEIEISDSAHDELTTLEQAIPRTRVMVRFEIPTPNTHEEIREIKARSSEDLLQRTNRMLRWYRIIGHRPAITELTLAQASPFHFTRFWHGPRDEELDRIWHEPFVFESVSPAEISIPADRLTTEIERSLMCTEEANWAKLLLLDAELALIQGRFREAVLNCWSVIDSVFTRKYEALVESSLMDEWSEARKTMTGIDFGLRTKMTIGLRLLINRSLFSEPNQLWERLSRSYSKRNKIIHAGDAADEADAKLAASVAHDIMRIMAEIPIPTTETNTEK